MSLNVTWVKRRSLGHYTMLLFVGYVFSRGSRLNPQQHKWAGVGMLEVHKLVSHSAQLPLARAAQSVKHPTANIKHFWLTIWFELHLKMSESHVYEWELTFTCIKLVENNTIEIQKFPTGLPFNSADWLSMLWSFVKERIIVVGFNLNCRGRRSVNETSQFLHFLYKALQHRHHYVSAVRKWIYWHTGNVNAGTSMQEHGLSQVYYWISVQTFNLFLWEWLLFPKEQADLSLRPGLVGHKHPHRDLGVMERQYMVNIHDKSPVRQVLIPPTKHGGPNIILEAKHKQLYREHDKKTQSGPFSFDKYKHD